MRGFSHFFIVASIVASAFVSPVVGEEGNAVTPDSRYRWDRFSGVPVRSENEAYSLILFRFSAAPRVSEPAPDGILINAEDGSQVTLHSRIADKPLVLIFGSASCNQIQLFEKDFGSFYERFKDHFDFAFVYLRSAHPEGGFAPETQREGAATGTPTEPDARSTEERIEDAVDYAHSLQLPFPVYIDPVDDAIAVRWGAWPSRIFVISPNKTTLYSGGPGPWYFQFTRDGWHAKPPETLDRTFRNSPFNRESLEEFLEKAAQ